MKAETKLKESEEEMQEFLALQMQKDLELKLIAELQEKLQLKQLEKTVIEEQEAKGVEETKEQEEAFLEYGADVEGAYSKDKGAYQAKSAYEKNEQEAQK